MSKASISVAPGCPFCSQNVERPVPPDVRKLGEFSCGICQCGAVYTSDPTGFNIGAAMIDALVRACNDNWELAWDLIPEEDYLTGRVEDYDEQTHQIVETRNLDGRVIKGVLYFVRLHKPIEDVRPISGANKISSAPLPEVEPVRDPKRNRKRADKTGVRQMVEEEDFDGLVDLCLDDKRTLRFFQRLLYEPVEEKRWKIAHVLGVVCGRVSTLKPGMVSDLLHRLFSSCADSSSANWGSVEAIGSIIAAKPDIFGAFTRHLLGLVADESMRVQIVWALATIAKSVPELVRSLSIYNLIGLLDHPDSQLKGNAIRLFGNLRAREVKHHLQKMVDDMTPVVIYEEGKQEKTNIGALAKKAIKLIEEEGEIP